MRKEKIEKWILLEDAGELDAFRGWLLKRALARAPEGRAWRDELAGLRACARAAAQPVPPTPRDVLAAILQAGSSAERASAPVFAGWRPAWAAAAALALGFALWLALPRSGALRMTETTPPATPGASDLLAWDDGWDDQLARFQVALESSRETGTDTESSSDELDRMASELLPGEEAQI